MARRELTLEKGPGQSHFLLVFKFELDAIDIVAPEYGFYTTGLHLIRALT
jgi:hypothetical protein